MPAEVGPTLRFFISFIPHAAAANFFHLLANLEDLRLHENWHSLNTAVFRCPEMIARCRAEPLELMWGRTRTYEKEESGSRTSSTDPDSSSRMNSRKCAVFFSKKRNRVKAFLSQSFFSSLRKVRRNNAQRFLWAATATAEGKRLFKRFRFKFRTREFPEELKHPKTPRTRKSRGLLRERADQGKLEEKARTCSQNVDVSLNVLSAIYCGEDCLFEKKFQENAAPKSTSLVRELPSRSANSSVMFLIRTCEPPKVWRRARAAFVGHLSNRPRRITWSCSHRPRCWYMEAAPSLRSTRKSHSPEVERRPAQGQFDHQLHHRSTPRERKIPANTSSA